MRVFQGAGASIALGNRTEQEVPIGGICYQIFGEGINLTEFAPKLARLNKQTVSLLSSVAVRISLINNIGGLGDYPSNSDFAPLQLYLLCTCIDALSNPEWLPFNDWLLTRKAKYNIASRDRRIAEIIEQFSQNQDETILRKSIHDLFGDYLKYHGTSKKFRQFFIELPGIINESIASGYMIFDGMENYLDPPVRQKWVDKPIQGKLETIADYLYRYRRNDFTHAGKTYSTAWESFFQTPKEALDTRPYKPNGALLYFWEDNNPNRNVKLVVIALHNEVFLLRTAIIAYCRHLLGISVSQEFILKHSERHHQSVIIRNVVVELQNNWKTYKFYSINWMAYEYQEDRYYGLPSFETKWLEAALDLNYSEYGVVESTLLQDTRQAVQLLLKMNEPIKLVNEEFPPLYIRNRRGDLQGIPEDFEGKIKSKVKLFDDVQKLYEYHMVRWYLPNLMQSYIRLLIEVPDQKGPKFYGGGRPDYYGLV